MNPNMTTIQTDSIIDHMEDHSLLAAGKLIGNEGVRNRNDQWDKVTEKVNDVGPKKSVEQVTAHWNYLKLQAKEYRADKNIFKRMTGNPVEETVLTNAQLERVLKIIGTSHHNGLAFSKELGLPPLKVIPIKNIESFQPKPNGKPVTLKAAFKALKQNSDAIKIRAGAQTPMKPFQQKINDPSTPTNTNSLGSYLPSTSQKKYILIPLAASQTPLKPLQQTFRALDPKACMKTYSKRTASNSLGNGLLPPTSKKDITIPPAEYMRIQAASATVTSSEKNVHNASILNSSENEATRSQQILSPHLPSSACNTSVLTPKNSDTGHGVNFQIKQVTLNKKAIAHIAQVSETKLHRSNKSSDSQLLSNDNNTEKVLSAATNPTLNSLLPSSAIKNALIGNLNLVEQTVLKEPLRNKCNSENVQPFTHISTANPFKQSESVNKAYYTQYGAKRQKRLCLTEIAVQALNDNTTAMNNLATAQKERNIIFKNYYQHKMNQKP